MYVRGYLQGSEKGRVVTIAGVTGQFGSLVLVTHRSPLATKIRGVTSNKLPVRWLFGNSYQIKSGSTDIGKTFLKAMMNSRNPTQPIKFKKHITSQEVNMSNIMYGNILQIVMGNMAQII